MNTNAIPYVAPLILSAAVAASLSLYCWKRRDVPLNNPTAIKVELLSSGLDSERLPEQVELAVYRVVQ